ncbi:MAG: hypothetical protein A2312_04455 [Candidatus Staskawiczbacteria bacterium RIFOXYB2_FULL_32_9]|uniref:TNFR-Cys domain-containing protein n=1 Tax=Candidatus Staskawiczbacteria bacterium RIFOXYD1_FULL_32_13 TaxID=1802234 RepID=A0A1G2JM20_9BACT|nr:MAG: hypothetical protein UR22_C0006G0025 [Parcubacteria group bacterium GW2011_GWC2_32_10]OGZ78469.1 MAG: hypothetical protein A2360_04190 [Candidatus Staskawiczbacteria bacterium RIFOXYB1_FULL_32_11]OGZ78794.1 MAG: hypothetical protein A2256_02365 [Candidatus Staskawiczbacteria bacterium RIFOXYA2_FULL_32_7]OGZ83765.1 MAG: hypothetical protein A2312_04455 [Candidatus Staskawiczbacteria bacterium RIFOXYB2_FULL_32_9]OGZ88003.1 MAG: hypothetical protein A2561_02850 [Candidatus Staskawiczbacter
MSLRFKVLFLVIIAIFLLVAGNFVLASTTDGTVSGVAWSENIGWINFGTSTGNIHVTDTVLTGTAWNKYFGWIKLNPTNGGVVNNAEGTLSGTAWGSNIGWINFSGVVINSSGLFTGTATGANTGDINFSCTNCNVTTDWRPASLRTSCGDGSCNGLETCSTCLADCGSCSVGGGQYCGDGSCNNGETCSICATDCGSCLSVCGDSTCNGSETCSTCETDCGACLAVCGNGVCNAGENCTLCETDCGACSITCGDGLCNGTETCSTCETDCGVCIAPPSCGDGSCNNGETCSTCENDCGACLITCGDGLCNGTETCSTCALDCGSCLPVCGDFVCNGLETCRNCPLDCATCPPVCGDSTCNDSESCSTCETDCGICLSNPIVSPIGGIDIKHNECNAENQCMPVAGIGLDACKVDIDCQTKNPVIEVINPIIKEVTEITEKQVENIKVITKEITKNINTPQGSAITKTISTAGVVITTAVVATNIVASSFSFVDIVSLFARLFGLIFTLFGIKKRILPWGTVYDSVTKQPLDPVRVTLKNLDGKDIVSAITDLDGRYGFLVDKGFYVIRVDKTNYVFPSKNLLGKTQDEVYRDLYFGEVIEVKKSGDAIVKNIPLDPIDFNFNEFTKKNQKLNRFYSKWDVIIRRVSDAFFVVGFVVAIIAYFSAPYPYNTVIIGLYVFLSVLVLLGLKPKASGCIVDKITGDVLPFSIIRVIISPYNVEFSHKVADARGRYFCLAPKGEYYVKVEKKNQDGSYSLVYTSPIKNGAKQGIVREKFKV